MPSDSWEPVARFAVAALTWSFLLVCATWWGSRILRWLEARTSRRSTDAKAPSEGALITYEGIVDLWNRLPESSRASVASWSPKIGVVDDSTTAPALPTVMPNLSDPQPVILVGGPMDGFTMHVRPDIQQLMIPVVDGATWTPRPDGSWSVEWEDGTPLSYDEMISQNKMTMHQYQRTSPTRFVSKDIRVRLQT